MASLENALNALFLAGGGSGRGQSIFLKSYSGAVSQALDAAADAAVEIVQESLSEPNNGASSRPGEPPRKRTGTLMRSIHWRRKQGSRSFPAPQEITREAFARFKQESPKQYRWYKSIRNDAYADPKMARPYPVRPQGKLFTRVIEVSPRANDLSDRQRLEYYSYFLESGWWSVVNPDHLDKGYSASDGLYEANELPAAKANPKPGLPVYHPRRPYLSLLQDRFATGDPQTGVVDCSRWRIGYTPRSTIHPRFWLRIAPGGGSVTLQIHHSLIPLAVADCSRWRIGYTAQVHLSLSLALRIAPGGGSVTLQPAQKAASRVLRIAPGGGSVTLRCD